MMARKILGIVAGIMLSIGVLMMIWAFQPAEQSETGEIPAGAEWVLYYKVSGWMDGHLSGDFVVAPGNGLVTAYIMDSEAYEGYMLTGIVSETLYAETGSSGSFAVDLPSSSTYYLFFEHSGTTIEQTIDVDMKVTGITIIMLVIGIALAIVSAVMTLVSFRMKAKDKPAQQPLTQQTGDVTMFDDKPKTP